MNRRRNLIISLLAALLSGVLVYCIYVLQLKQIELQETVEIIVPSRFVATGEQMTADMLTTKWIAKASYEPEMIIRAADVVHLETSVPLGEGEPILAWKISPYRLMPKRDESTFQIPREYVLSVSNGIRAGDQVVLYVSGEESVSSRLFDQLVTVASVKTSGNLEVDDPKNPNLLSLADGDLQKMYASRRDANAMIDYVNLNLTEEQWLQIDQLCKQGGHKLVIAYSPMSMDAVKPQLIGGGS